MPWLDIALVALWVAAFLYACHYWLTTYRRDDNLEHHRRQLLKEIDRHESGNHEA